MNTRSLRFRLIAWYASLVAGVFVLLGVLMVFGLSHYLVENLGQTQLRRARQIADTLLTDVRKTGDPYVVHEIETLYAPAANERFIRVTRPDGSTLYQSSSAQDLSFEADGVPPTPVSGKPEFSMKVKTPGGKGLLIGGLHYTAPDGGRYLVEVGAPTAHIEAMVRRLALQLALGLPVIVLMALGGGYLLVQRALAPVEEMARKAEQITQHNLGERLPVAPTADELQQLAASLNHMLSRLEDAVLNSKRFVADASHELRTPLTVLRGELESVAQDGRIAPDLRERLGSALEEVERLANIVEGLFAISRLDAGEAQAKWARFDLAELVSSTADQISLLAEDKDISIVADDTQPVPVEGDRARLKQVVVNLLDNAIKYTPAHGQVKLHVRPVNGHAVLEVADTGCGIPAEALPHVFERFFRVDKTRSREPGGAGLGLSIVKSICTAHNAEVEVESQPGKGSVFRVRLPLSKKLNH